MTPAGNGHPAAESNGGAAAVPNGSPAAEPNGRSAAGPASGLLVCAPLRLEARAVRRGIGDGGTVLATGYGPQRAARQAALLRHSEFGVLAVAGTGGGLTRDLLPGDLVVGTEISDGTSTTQCASAALLAGELRRAGLRAQAGRVVTVDHLVRGSERERLAAGGALVADLESAPLAAAAGNRPVAVLRAVSDTPQRPLLHPGGLAGGLAALRSLRAAAPVLARWAAATGQRRVLLSGPRSFWSKIPNCIGAT